MNLLAALQFPPIEELLEWPSMVLKGWFAVNKVVALTWLAVALVIFMFVVAGRRKAMVPRGIQNVVESAIDFVRNDIVLQTIGPEGMRYTPLLLTLFFFIFMCNMFEVIPVIQFPPTARMALPAFMAICVWAIFNFVGLKSQGFRGYMRSVLKPPGVPFVLLLLVVPIEFISTLIVRPFTLAVRLFANMLAGHLLLVTFEVLTATLITAKVVFMKPIAVLPFAMLVIFIGFEILVAVLQAFIFTILAAVYIGGAMHPEH